jgi:hypothetical protein
VEVADAEATAILAQLRFPPNSMIYIFVDSQVAYKEFKKIKALIPTNSAKGKPICKGK